MRERLEASENFVEGVGVLRLRAQDDWVHQVGALTALLSDSIYSFRHPLAYLTRAQRASNV
jgi:hypothetical protein